jgi:hypothetical protein
VDKRGALGLQRALFQSHDPIRVRVRQRLQKGGIDKRENGRIRADAKGEREHGDRAKTRTLEHGAQRVAQILSESFQRCPSPHGPRVLLYQRRVAESPARSVSGLFSSQASLLLVFRLQVQMRAEFTIEVLIATLA